MTINRQNSPLFLSGLAQWGSYVALYTGPLDFSKSVYAGKHKQVTATCPEHGDFSREAKYLLMGRGCPQCGVAARGRKIRLTQQECLERFRATHGDRYDYSRVVYTKQSTHVEIRCPDHGVFMQKPEFHFGGSGCPQCAEAHKGTTQRGTLEGMIDKVTAAHGGNISVLSTEYTGAYSRYKMRCAAHSREFDAVAAYVTQGQNPCPVCVSRTSRAEGQVADFVEASLGTPVVRNTRSIIAPLELDILVPERMLAVEYHGLYSHSSAIHEPRNKQLEKWRRCTEKGYRLIQVFEDEWLDRRPAVENRLKAALGVAPVRYARKCVLKRHLGSGAGKPRAFLEQWHTQGAGRHVNLYYTLEHDGEIVAAMSVINSNNFGSTVHATHEMSRFATLGTVVGAMSRLVAAFRTDFPDAHLMSYCDLRYGDGHGYEKCGFTLVGMTEPDWWWYRGGRHWKRIPRQATQKRNIPQYPELNAVLVKNPTYSGVQVAVAAGWRQVRGVGSKIYLLKP